MKKRLLGFSVVIILIGLACAPLLPVTGKTAEGQNITSSVFSQNSLFPLSFNSFKTNSPISWVIAQNHFYLPVVEQPASNPAFVSNEPNVLTYFSMTESYGSIGFLAHSHLSGSQLKYIESGDIINLVRKNLEYESYQVVSIREFQALSPASEYSYFIDLEDEVQYSASELFLEIYGINGRVVFQTCLEKDGVEMWGRIFVIALPLLPDENLNKYDYDLTNHKHEDPLQMQRSIANKPE